MKNITKNILFTFLLLILLLSIPSPVFAESFHSDKVVFGGSYRLKSGDTLNGSLAIFGGQASLEEDSIVTGDILITGGTLDIYGEVQGNITAIGGSVYIGDTAEINGDIATIGSSIKQSEEAEIHGNLTFEVPSDITIPSFPIIPRLNILSSPNSWMPTFNFKPIGNIIGAFFQAIALAALAILLALFFEKPTERIVKSIMSQPIVSAGLGLLSIIVIPGILTVLAITIILIPISLLGFLSLFLAVIFGWVAIGLEVGNRLSGMFKQTWSTPVAAGIGTFTMTLVVKFFSWIPCIGWIIPLLVIVVGLGGIMISRFGTKVYSNSDRMVNNSQNALPKDTTVQDKNNNEDTEIKKE